MTHPVHTLADLKIGESAILAEIRLPDEISHRLMQMGMIPGCLVTAAHQAPAGDPVVYRVDGTEIALRRETSRKIGIEALPVVQELQLGAAVVATATTGERSRLIAAAVSIISFFS